MDRERRRRESRHGGSTEMRTIDLSALFPSHIAVVGVTEPRPAPLEAEEELLLGSIGERRRRDFATGRACAGRALALLGVNGGAIQRGASGEPVWPAGICGSITHCDGCWAAAVARSRDTRSLGLDAERRRVFSDAVRRAVTLPAERDAQQRCDPRVPWDLLLFSAKESVFKAWYPIAGRWLGFHHARVEIDYEHQTFDAFVLAQGEYAASLGLSTVRGRYRIDDHFVFTAVVVPAATASVFGRVPT
jgi:4'-phosphopantetheinyl transferase EntD